MLATVLEEFCFDYIAPLGIESKFATVLSKFEILKLFLVDHKFV